MVPTAIGFHVTFATAARPSPRVDPAQHVKWARTIARSVRADFGFLKGSQEELELESAAYLEMTRKCHQFHVMCVPPGGDPVGAFRGWACVAVRGECKREARRLRNGGLYNTRRERFHAPVEICYTSQMANPDGTPRELPDPRETPDAD